MRTSIFATVGLALVVALPAVAGAQDHDRRMPRRAGVVRIEGAGYAGDAVDVDAVREAHFRLTSMHRAHAMDHLVALHDYADNRASDHRRVHREMELEHVAAIGEHLVASQRHQTAEERSLSYEQRRRNHDELEA